MTASAPPMTAPLTGMTPPASEAITADPPVTAVWPLWQKALFRFFFVYFLLQIAPWNWFRSLPFVSTLTQPYSRLMRWAVYASNAQFFHVRETLIPMNGSGDTSYAWAQLWFYLSLAAVACVVWSVLDRKRPNYERMSFWLRMIVRYYIATFALSYGIIKLFALQMGFPTISQLATPLGDLLPMRFSWLFIGYSLPYQIFSGIAETTAGLLLLYKRTVTAGLLAAMGAFLNVVMINLAYDVPVKLFAMHLLFSSIFLLAMDYKRLLSFFLLNQTTPGTKAYDWRFTKPWQRYGSFAVKALMVWLILITPLRNGWASYKNTKRPLPSGPFPVGVYDVKSYVVKQGASSVLSADSIRWKDVIFDNRGAGSINTQDTVFWHRYRRGYFRFKPDTVAHTAAVWRSRAAIPGDSTFLFTMRYAVPDSNTIRLWAMIRGDSVYVELARTDRHFQLTERQFHWLSEYNR